MKSNYILSSILACMTAIAVNAQGNLVIVKKDGQQMSYALDKNPYMLFTQDNIQINSSDQNTTINYLDFNYFCYQGNQGFMNTIIETSKEKQLFALDNGRQVPICTAPKHIATNKYYDEIDDKGDHIYTKNCQIQKRELDSSSPYFNALPFNSYLDVMPLTAAAQPYITFSIPQIGAGTYDLYAVTLPLSILPDVSEDDVMIGYKFRANLFYRTNEGGWPKTRSEVMKNPSDPSGKSDYTSNLMKADTIFLGSISFDNDQTYYPSMLVQIQSYVSTAETRNKLYSKRMGINCIMMKAHDEGFSTTNFVQVDDSMTWSVKELQRISFLNNLSFTQEFISNDMMSTQLRVQLENTPYYSNVDFYGLTLTPDENGIIRIPYILFPGYEYVLTPSFLDYVGNPMSFTIDNDNSQIFSTKVDIDDTKVNIHTELSGMKTFWETNVKGINQRYGNYSSDYYVGIELTNTNTGETIVYKDSKGIIVPSGLSKDNQVNLSDVYEYSVNYNIFKLGYNQTYKCRAFLQYGYSDGIPQIKNTSIEYMRYYDSNVITFTTPTREEYENELRLACLPQIMAQDPTISLFNQAIEATKFSSLLEKYVDENYSLSEDSIDQWFPQATAVEYDIVGYMETRYYGYTGFIETDEAFANHGIKTLDELRRYAKQVYDEVYPEDANITDETDRRNSLNRFVAYHFLPARIEYNMLTADNVLLRAFDRDHWDVADWYETMLPYSIMKVSYPAGANAGRYVNRRGLKDGPDWRGVFVEGSKILSPQESQNELKAINGVYHYIDNIIDYGRNTQEVVLDERLRLDATTLSPDFLTSGARGHGVVGTGGVPSYPGQYGASNSSSDPNKNPNYCLGFKAGAAQNFYYNDGQTHLHVRNRYLNFWSYQGDEVQITGNFDVTFKIPPVPKGDYEVRIATCLGFSNRGIMAFYFDGKPCGLPRDMRKGGQDPSIGYKHDDDLGDTEAIVAYDRAMHTRGWMKGPASYGTLNQDGTGSPYWMRNAADMLRQVITTFHSDGKTDHYIRVQQLLDIGNMGTFAFDYLELCPSTVYDNELYPEDKW